MANLYANVKEAAQILGCCEETIRRMLRSGGLEHRRLGRAYRIPMSELLPAREGEGAENDLEGLLS
jgi:excisionase family DNA binding protein